MSNCKSHIKSKHPKIFRVLSTREKGTTLKNNLRQQTLLPYSMSAVVQISKADVLKGLLHSITVDGRPFSSVDDGLMRIGFAPVLKRLPVKYNRNNIVDLLDEAADYLRKKMKNILQDKMVSVKVDAVSRFSRSFLGINIQVS